ncbi:MAG: hypothetical protein M1834_006315 [Cirrosporium novae-zelandiae]|nr:MAG: hypothetical protein M1834_006315 [Cirrosporium novae-zelandiae]
MVSFSCEACGDVLTKKKLDAHKNQCRGASYTCLDCMVHFSGTTYKAHTSCMTEAQKYQGAFYKEKPAKSKQKQKSVTIAEPPMHPSRRAYVEDALDPEDSQDNAVAIVDAPPPAPSPPPPKVNVFDFLIAEDTPNASRTSLLESKEEMAMVEHAPSAFDAGQELTRTRDYSDEESLYDVAYEENGYSYGSDPVRPMNGDQFKTPGPKKAPARPRNKEKGGEKDHVKHTTSDKKRKRQHVDDLDLSLTQQRERDEVMTDAPPILHSGLTGGLNGLLSKRDFPTSPQFLSDDERHDPDPTSPLKRSKNTNGHPDHQRPNIKSFALIRTRRSSSDDARPRKKHHTHKHHHHRESSSRHPRKQKLLEYPGHSKHGQNDTENQQLVVYRNKAELFMSFVTKGPESERGCSVNKALKRYHRERGGKGLGLGKSEEEKELWKTLRLKRNDRGEVVVFF